MTTDQSTIPEILRQIRDEAMIYSKTQGEKDDLQTEWASHVSEVRKRIPIVHIEQGGEALYLGEISPGCRACKDGKWDCIFLTMECNLNCSFCWRPNSYGPQHIGSAICPSRQKLADIYEKICVSGISFSGGETFLDTQLLLGSVSWFTSRYPDNYYWVYTNGLLVTEEVLSQLAELGLSEIRFNMAASGYVNPIAMRNLAIAARYIKSVTIEIPAIPEDAQCVLSSIEKWCEAGTRYLNLHELVFEPGTNSAVMPGLRKSGNLHDGHRFDYSPGSRDVTLAVMEKVYKERLPLGINDCSLQSKVRQIRGRRRLLAPVMSSPHEKLLGGQALESYCVYHGSDVLFFHPDHLNEMRDKYPDCRFVRLVRMVPLGWNDRGQWLTYETI